MKIGLMGFEFSSPNKGCEALVYSFLQILSDIGGSESVIYNFSGTDLGVIPHYFREFDFVNASPRLKDVQMTYLRQLKSCDYVFDITMGDSFTDIYSKGYYDSLLLHKWFASQLCKHYILLPQTYGPFLHKNSDKKARYIFKLAERIYCRDELSQHLLIDHFSITDSVLVSDLAFILPYDKTMYSFSKKKKIGINISGLLYRGGFTHDNQFGMMLDYPLLIQRLIESLMKQYEVHLIPHVIDLSENAHDDDYIVCCDLHQKYADTILAPAFQTPIDAKSYISNMDFFIGSRMHSTIAAFSSGVITIPVSYSRKFEGLYQSLNYDYVVNGKMETTDSAYNKILKYINEETHLGEAQNQSMIIVDERKKKFVENLRTLLTGEK